MAKTKVAILYGGRSVEHGVSINSARNIAANIDQKKFEAILIGISKQGVWYLNASVTKDIEQGKKLSLQLNPSAPSFVDELGNTYHVDMIFPVLHGTDGEDGSIQGLLKAMELPMAGTGVLGSSISINKLMAKQVLQQAGLPVGKFHHFFYADKTKINFKEISASLGLPLMVKSANLGSSVGVSKVKSESEFASAVEDSFRYDDCVLFEEYIQGREIECSILGNNPPKASLPAEIILNSKYEFYSFDAKYVDGDAVTIDVPAKLDHDVTEQIREISVKAFQALHGEDFARVDLFLRNDGKIFVNEINTIPGFTNSSMFPVMWNERGISFSDLITKIIELASERFEKSKRIERDFQSSLKF
ncbi:MAG TPA: D-alanine--D-alanine ligase family protein [Cyclobacteriaceae bacterium]|nr:D-alanine--D-alanine ligase family protein [Cyclobacteriaceae bacterium]